MAGVCHGVGRVYRVAACPLGGGTVETEEPDGWDRMATVFHDGRGLGREGRPAVNGDVPGRCFFMLDIGDEPTVRVVCPQGQELEHDVIPAKVDGEVQRCLFQHVTGVDVRPPAEGLLGTDERSTVDGIKKGRRRVDVHTGMAAVPIVAVGTGQGGWRCGTAGILAGFGLFLGVHGILLGLGFIGRLCMGTMGWNHHGDSRKTDGKSETGQE